MKWWLIRAQKYGTSYTPFKICNYSWHSCHNLINNADVPEEERHGVDVGYSLALQKFGRRCHPTSLVDAVYHIIDHSRLMLEQNSYAKNTSVMEDWTIPCFIIESEVYLIGL